MSIHGEKLLRDLKPESNFLMKGFGLPMKLSINPTVNKRLEEMDVQNIPIEEGKKQFKGVDKGDVVIVKNMTEEVNLMDAVLLKRNFLSL